MSQFRFRLSCLLGPVLALTCALPAMAQRAISPDQLQSRWILLNTKVDATVPNSGKNLDKPGCAAVSFMIGSDGVPRNLVLRKVVPASDLGPVAMSVVGNFRYGPSLSNRVGDPVNTYYVVPFNAPADPAGQKALMAPCQLPGYGGGG